jgi:hypothetical protein
VLRNEIQPTVLRYVLRYALRYTLRYVLRYDARKNNTGTEMVSVRLALRLNNKIPKYSTINK